MSVGYITITEPRTKKRHIIEATPEGLKRVQELCKEFLTTYKVRTVPMEFTIEKPEEEQFWKIILSSPVSDEVVQTIRCTEEEVQKRVEAFKADLCDGCMATYYYKLVR